VQMHGAESHDFRDHRYHSLLAVELGQLNVQSWGGFREAQVEFTRAVAPKEQTL
jgi:hypothetical protein